MIFPGTTIPVLPEGFKNCSYRNDICTHFEREWGRYVIEIWIAQDDPDDRECDFQYLVGIKEQEESEFIEFVEFNRTDFSIEGSIKISRRLKLETYKLMKKYRSEQA